MSAKGVGLTFLWKLLELPCHELPNGSHIVDAFMWSLRVVLDEPRVDLFLDDFDRLREIDAFPKQAFLLECPIEPFSDRILFRRMRVGEELHDVFSFVILNACPQILRAVVVDLLLDGLSEMLKTSAAASMVIVLSKIGRRTFHRFCTSGCSSRKDWSWDAWRMRWNPRIWVIPWRVRIENGGKNVVPNPFCPVLVRGVATTTR